MAKQINKNYVLFIKILIHKYMYIHILDFFLNFNFIEN